MSGRASTEPRALLSACVLAYDDEDRLARCLQSIRFADEIVVVVDAKSTDATEKVARENATLVCVDHYHGDVSQKRKAIELATHPWVLLLDSDEVVSEGLAEQIAGFLESRLPGDAVVGAEINRLTFHLGRWIRHGDFYPDWKLRLFRRDRANVGGRDPHGRVVVDGPVVRLTGDLEHYSYRDLSDQVARIQRFSSEGAAALYEEGIPFRLSSLCLRPPARFARAYLLKRGFLDGMAGFIVALATAFHVFLKYAKLWELERGTRRD